MKTKILNESSKPNIISENVKTSFIKATIQRYFTGFICYGINQTGQIKSHFIRNFAYTKILRIDIEKHAIIYGGAEIRTPNKLKIGKGTIIGNFAILDARNGINIGENVNFSHGVWLWTEQHDYNCPNFSTNNPKNKTITIKDRAWLGPRVIVLPGCTIGEGAVVAAGAVVTKDIEPFSLNGGVPCKKIGERNQNLKYIFTENPTPFL
jgi:acetyltransferase-like isoleucine patch superfamily enzyme